jgi:hypothetical protein
VVVLCRATYIVRGKGGTRGRKAAAARVSGHSHAASSSDALLTDGSICQIEIMLIRRILYLQNYNAYLLLVFMVC